MFGVAFLIWSCESVPCRVSLGVIPPSCSSPRAPNSKGHEKPKCYTIYTPNPKLFSQHPKAYSLNEELPSFLRFVDEELRPFLVQLQDPTLYYGMRLWGVVIHFAYDKEPKGLL